MSEAVHGNLDHVNETVNGAHGAVTETAHQAASHGLDFGALIFDSNVINFVVIMAAIIWALTKFIPQMAAKQKEVFEAEIKAAKAARKAAEAKLKDLEERLSSSEDEFKNIVVEAEAISKEIKKDVLADAEHDIQRMRDTLERDIGMKKNLAIQSIKEVASRAAIDLTEECVRNLTDDPVLVKKIQARSMDQLATLK